MNEIRRSVNSSKEKEKLFDLRKYILDNFEGIKSRDKIREIELEGVRFPGIIEGNIDKVISNRFKKRGCCWSIKGCDSLFQVRLKVKNGELERVLKRTKVEGRKLEIMDEEYKAIDYDGIKGKRDYSCPADLPCFYLSPVKPWIKVLKRLVEGDKI